jgi:hypothetical protein
MNNFRHDVRTGIACYLIGIPILLSSGFAQQNINAQLTSQYNKASEIIPFFEKEQTIGTPYLSRNWMPGVLELSNHKRIPDAEERLLFNFDKINNVVYIVNRSNIITRFPIDSVFGFNLVGNNNIYVFEKVSWISDNFFLTPIVKSEKGYSLYKRLFTKLIQADFTSEGYYTKGKRFDEYVDYYEYYISYPGNKLFRKIFLKEKYIRKALREDSKLLDEFFIIHDNDISEPILIGIIEYLNNNKFPE